MHNLIEMSASANAYKSQCIARKLIGFRSVRERTFDTHNALWTFVLRKNYLANVK